MDSRLRGSDGEGRGIGGSVGCVGLFHPCYPAALWIPAYAGMTVRDVGEGILWVSGRVGWIRWVRLLCGVASLRFRQGLSLGLVLQRHRFCGVLGLCASGTMAIVPVRTVRQRRVLAA